MNTLATTKSPSHLDAAVLELGELRVGVSVQHQVLLEQRRGQLVLALRLVHRLAALAQVLVGARKLHALQKALCNVRSNISVCRPSIYIKQHFSPYMLPRSQ